MGMFDALNISSSGLTAQRLRMDVIANNIANVNTTRTSEGGPFRRSQVVLRPRSERWNFKSHFLPEALKNHVGEGVRVLKVEKDAKPPRLKYDPTHPDALDFGPNKGYVELPNVNIVEEMVDMISATRAYEANVSLMNSSKQMFNRGLEIGLR
ncbi:MAG: flagellar basal body rod protein FlgC [Spirochaetota bacterium]|nr:flagellar basal body rod protein FlgC [Spirochaetota bacterium]